MSDEQTIYISPEDDLTNVRERLEHIQSRRVTLVIPSQTQLRSHVAWKLLYARARELGKEVLIISSDPQVRSVAHAVKFKVAHSLESTPSASKSRTGSTRPTRGGSASPGRPRTSGAASMRSASPQRALPSRDPGVSPSQKLTGKRTSRTLHPPLQPDQGPRWYDLSPQNPAARHDFGASTYDSIDEVSPENLSSTFDPSEKRFGPVYDSRVHTSPPIRPLPPEQIEEPDMLIEDYEQAQNIREAASGGFQRSELTSVPEDDSRPDDRVQHYQPAPTNADDPFSYMEDSQPPPRAEQRGAINIQDDDIDEPVIQDVADLPTSVIEGRTHYSGTLAERQSAAPVGHEQPEPAPDIEFDADDTPRIYGTRSRQGRLSSTPLSRQGFDDDALPPVEERPIELHPRSAVPEAAPPRSRVTRPGGKQPAGSAKRPSGAMSTGTGRPGGKPDDPIQLGSRQAAPAGRSGGSQTGKVRSAQGTRPGPGTASARPQQRPASAGQRRPRNTRVLAIRVAITAAIVIFVMLLVYFIPATSVTVTLAAQDYTHPVTLTASTLGGAHMVPAHAFSKTFSTSGSGSATGSKNVGTSPATGSVVFTNKGATLIDIPSQTVISTASGIQFTTVADVVAPAQADSPVVNITAVQPGDTGDVGAGAINLIPDESLTRIASYQLQHTSKSDLQLTVTNAAATTGGGVQPTHAITADDLSKAQSGLIQQLQPAIATWQKPYTLRGFTDKPVIVKTDFTAPAVDSIEASGSFADTIKLTVTFLLVNNTDLQRATAQQLDAVLQKTGNAVVNPAHAPIQIGSPTTTNTTASSMTISFTATAKQVPNVNSAQLQDQIVGRSQSDARSIVLRQTHAKQVTVQTTPGFISWVAFWKNHISITVLPDLQNAAPAKPKK